MGAKRPAKSEIRHLKAILKICKANSPDLLKDQNVRIANEIKKLEGKKSYGKV